MGAWSPLRIGARALAMGFALTTAGAGCNDWQTPADAESASEAERGGSGGQGGATPIYPPDPKGLHVVKNQIQDDTGRVIVLHGVNRSGTEYACVNGSGIFDGRFDEASIQAMLTWHINAVRIPLNETCWLGINGVSPELSGERYQAAIESYVNLLHKYRLTPILELHWTAQGSKRAVELQPMPDADHAPTFWAQVATRFRDDTGVVFEMFNEPFPDQNRDTDAAWTCWRDGCLATPWAPAMGVTPESYQATGMQALVTAVRSTGATHLILLGGVQYSNGLSQWQKYKPADPLGNLAAAWHIYNFNSCNNSACWQSVLSAPSALGQSFPIVATEIGEDDCDNKFVNPLMNALEEHGSGYLAWSWNTSQACTPKTAESSGNPWPLVTDYTSGTPSGPYAQAIKDRFLLGSH